MFVNNWSLEKSRRAKKISWLRYDVFNDSDLGLTEINLTEQSDFRTFSRGSSESWRRALLISTPNATIYVRVRGKCDKTVVVLVSPLDSIPKRITPSFPKSFEVFAAFFYGFSSLSISSDSFEEKRMIDSNRAHRALFEKYYCYSRKCSWSNRSAKYSNRNLGYRTSEKCFIGLFLSLRERFGRCFSHFKNGYRISRLVSNGWTVFPFLKRFYFLFSAPSKKMPIY